MHSVFNITNKNTCFTQALRRDPERSSALQDTTDHQCDLWVLPQDYKITARFYQDGFGYSKTQISATVFDRGRTNWQSRD